MQATSHVNRICLSQSAVSVHCFHAYSKGSRVSLQSTQTSWTFTWLRVLLSYYLSLSTTCTLLQPSAFWQNCLFRPCWVECPVLKGILLWSWSHMLLSFTEEFIWIGVIWTCGTCKNPFNVAVSSIQALQWHKKHRERLNFIIQRHKHNQYNNSEYTHTGSKK